MKFQSITNDISDLNLMQFIITNLLIEFQIKYQMKLNSIILNSIQ